MAAVAGKRPAPVGTCCPAAAGKKKRAHYDYELGSVYNYERLETVGRGTYGTVVKAEDKRTGETVAIKWIHPGDEGVTDLNAVYHEASCLEACRGHPSIVQMKEVVVDEAYGDVFIVMEFVGPTLKSRLPPPRRLSDAEIRAVMRQLLRGAEKLHGAGLIHRDIKPDNILVGPAGALKICDLGMAARARPAGDKYPEEEVAALWYRAPELLGGSRTYGPAVDLWALGCVMGELLFGEPLFDHAETEDDVLHSARDLEYSLSLRPSTSSTDPGDARVLSDAGHEVLQGLLRVAPEKRLTAADALSRRWFKEEEEHALALSLALPSQKDQPDFIGFLYSAESRQQH